MIKRFLLVQVNKHWYAIDRKDDQMAKELPIDTLCLCISDHLNNDDHPPERYINPIRKSGKGDNCYSCNQIIATTDKSLELPLLPPVEECFKNLLKLAENDFNKTKTTFRSDALKILAFNDWIRGYKAASAKKYDEKDIRRAFRAGENYENSTNYPNAPDENEYVQSFETLPIAVELEMYYQDINVHIPNWNPKVDSNNFVNVLKWIYE